MSLDYHKTLIDVFDKAVARHATSKAFTCMGHSLTFEELDKLTARFAVWLQKNTDLKPGDRIAIQLPNVLQYPVAVYGALRAGLILVNMNPLYTPHEIEHQLNDSGAKALVVLANIAANAAGIIQNTPVKTVIVTELADLHPPVKRCLINFVVKHIKKLVPHFNFTNVIQFRKCLTLSEKDFLHVQRDPEDIAILQYTGGTTGIAKGAMLSHRNLVANMLQVNEHMKRVFRENQEMYIAPLPLYHIYSFTLHCTSAFTMGNHSVLIPNPRDIPAFVNTLKGLPFTLFVGLNTLFNALMRNSDFQQLDFSHLQLTSSGGMALTAETYKKWIALTKAPLLEGYGLTETSPVVTINPFDAPVQGTIGIVMPETECKVVDENRKTLSVGEAGELCIRGPQVMKGYWQRPEATAEVIDSEGWFYSGDIAVIQADGYIRIVDRKKDMINVSGFKVFPNEVEDALCGHADIIEAAVIGLPDVDGGELVKAFIVTKNPELTADQVRRFAKGVLTAYKVPKQIEFRADLPKTNVGKILRRELRNQELAKASS